MQDNEFFIVKILKNLTRALKQEPTNFHFLLVLWNCTQCPDISVLIPILEIKTTTCALINVIKYTRFFSMRNHRLDFCRYKNWSLEKVSFRLNANTTVTIDPQIKVSIWHSSLSMLHLINIRDWYSVRRYALIGSQHKSYRRLNNGDKPIFLLHYCCQNETIIYRCPADLQSSSWEVLIFDGAGIKLKKPKLKSTKNA